MDGLEILHPHRLQVPLRGFHAGMPEHPREVEEIATRPEVAHSERVTEGMR